MSRVTCFTSFSFSYLTRAIVLARTLRTAHPDWEIWAVIVDQPPRSLDTSSALADFDKVIYASELGFERFKPWLFKHDIVEACTAVKGQMLCHLLDRGADKVVYFDPDIAVFHRLDSVIKKLDSASILLTPHQVSPNRTLAQLKDNELTSMQFGIFNLGFLAVRNDEVGRDFARWWTAQLYYACYDEIERGLFTDQKWCDLVPAMFERVQIDRDPGCNVASWNISTRKLYFDKNGSALVNGSPLKFYHFTKINGLGDFMTEKYAGENVEIIEIWNWYKRAIADVSCPGIPKGYWHYGAFANGENIPKAARILFRNRSDIFSTFDDPYATHNDSFYAWLNRFEPAILQGDGREGYEPI